MHQVLMYEDPMRQEAARKTVPMDELQEKALVSLAKVSVLYLNFQLCLFLLFPLHHLTPFVPKCSYF
jgi:hypothetical protein